MFLKTSALTVAFLALNVHAFKEKAATPESSAPSQRYSGHHYTVPTLTCSPGSAPNAQNDCYFCPSGTASIDGEECVPCPGDSSAHPGSARCVSQNVAEVSVEVEDDSSARSTYTFPSSTSTPDYTLEKTADYTPTYTSEYSPSAIPSATPSASIVYTTIRNDFSEDPAPSPSTRTIYSTVEAESEDSEDSPRTIYSTTTAPYKAYKTHTPRRMH